ncbi:hypothetical protein MPH_13352 [Macrophomina phaseolina MS6]|uniref:BAH domain-containing protein n=1 Tax=Macrophomina phaseolina (strain MS6) TaxID=1126212 RepID=K2RYT3_MACPH|nr:hypothetical protein MPH_13352 [Macrophomina phaseolina MS6]
MFQVGDLVWIRLTGEPDALAEIVEAKAVGDGISRILIRIFWCYSRRDVLYIMRQSYPKRFAASYKYVKSNHTQVILWDTIQRKITETERRLILPKKVLGRSRKPFRICNPSAPEVSWSGEVLVSTFDSGRSVKHAARWSLLSFTSSSNATWFT